MADEEKKETAQSKVTEAKSAATKVDEPKKDDKKEKPEVSGKFKDLVKQIEGLSVLELSELVKTLEDHFGVSAAAPVAMAAVPAAGGEPGASAGGEEKTDYSVVLSSAGEKKIEVIKTVREISGLGLAESKALVDGAPKTVKENLPKAEADEAKSKLEAAGASVELK